MQGFRDVRGTRLKKRVSELKKISKIKEYNSKWHSMACALDVNCNWDSNLNFLCRFELT